MSFQVSNRKIPSSLFANLRHRAKQELSANNSLWRRAVQFEGLEGQGHALALPGHEGVGALQDVLVRVEKYGRSKLAHLGGCRRRRDEALIAA